jgi:5-methylcytosine-specific restriction endonuclease McrA
MKTNSEQWLDALAWDDKTAGVPTIVSRMIRQHAEKSMRKAKPFKPSIKIPKGNIPVTLSKLKKELDRVFSIFIRERDSSEYGIGKCVTCGLTKHWREMDAGHYVPRQDLATRWDEKNVHIQCKKCNGFRGGEPEKMAAYIDAYYGSGESEELKAKSKDKFRPSRDWMQSKIKHYKAINGKI